MPTFTPLDDQVLIRRELGETMQGALHVPDRAVERPLIGVVLAVGPGRRLETGGRLEPAVHAGQRVLFRKYAGDDVKFDGVDCILVRESDILGVLEEDGPIAVAHDGGEAVLAAIAGPPPTFHTGGMVTAGSRAGKTIR